MNPFDDTWGEPLLTASRDAAAAFDRGVEALATLDGDPVSFAETAAAADPDFVLAKCLSAHAMLYPMTRQSRLRATGLLKGLSENDDRIDFRTRSHLSAASAWANGDLHGAIANFEACLLAHPRDLLAAKVVQDLYLFIGDSVNLRDCVNRVFLSWPSELPGHDHLLAMRSFGLEENYCFDDAEILGRQALSLNPRNVYARHSIAHVYEMLGTRTDGTTFLLNSQADWETSASNIHMWWHLALLYLDEADYDGAKRIYDQRLCGTREVVMHDIVDRAALLWRLYLLGVDVSERGAHLWADSQRFVDDGVYVFNEFHMVMSAILGGRAADAQSLIDTMRARLGNGYDSNTLGEVGVPLCRGLMHFAEGHFREATDLLLAIRQRTAELGGSHAQRDVIFETIMVAAAAAGDEALTGALRGERILTRPNWESPTLKLIDAGRNWRKRGATLAAG